MKKILLVFALAFFASGLWHACAKDNAASASSVVKIAEASANAKIPASGVVSYADTLEKIIPAVVAVYPSGSVELFETQAGSLEDFFRRFYGMPFDDMPSAPSRPNSNGKNKEKVPLGSGSGVILSADGYILTNHHVVTADGNRPAEEILVRLSDNREFKATLVGSDPKTDIAVLKIDAKDLPFATVADSDSLRVGDIVFAIGNPMQVGTTVTMGIVSAMGRSELNIISSQSGVQGYENFIQTDASINPGNSGGALVDAKGNLVGINTAILSRSGGNIGIGFAIPVNMARGVLEDIVSKGSVDRGYLGVRIANLNSDLSEAFGLKSNQGALVEAVEENSPADKAGIKRGDVITSINSKRVQNAPELRLKVSQISPGDKATLEIIRGGKPMSLTLNVGNLEEALASAETKAGELLEGVNVAPLSESLREKYNIDPAVKEGLVITQTRGNSPYARTLREGMVIVEINDQAAKDLGNAKKAVAKGINKFWIYHRGGYNFIAIRTS